MPERERNEKALLSSAEVLQFIEAAGAFCETIDQIDSFTEIEFLLQVEEHLPVVYSRGTRLDWPWGSYEGEDDNVLLSDPILEMPHGGMIPWTDHLRCQIGLKLGWHRLLNFVWDPAHPSNHEVVQLDLALCLAEIYADLRLGLLLYEQGTRDGRTQALWDWKFGMKLGWGSHAAEAMLPLQRLIHLHYDEDDEVFKP